MRIIDSEFRVTLPAAAEEESAEEQGRRAEVVTREMFDAAYAEIFAVRPSKTGRPGEA